MNTSCTRRIETSNTAVCKCLAVTSFSSWNMADLFSMTPMEKKASKRCWDFDIRFYKVVRGQTDLKSPLTQVRLLMRDKSTLQWVPQQVARKQTKGACMEGVPDQKIRVQFSVLCCAEGQWTRFEVRGPPPPLHQGEVLWPPRCIGCLLAQYQWIGLDSCLLVWCSFHVCTFFSGLYDCPRISECTICNSGLLY